MKNKCNTLFFKIIIVVLGAILCLAGALSVLNIKTSQDVFVENFVESQQKIFSIPSKEFRDICDEMWYLYTSREERIRRLKESRGYSDEKIAGIMANQASEEEFRNFTDCEINNSGTEEETSLQIQKLLCGKDNETA